MERKEAAFQVMWVTTHNYNPTQMASEPVNLPTALPSATDTHAQIIIDLYFVHDVCDRMLRWSGYNGGRSC